MAYRIGPTINPNGKYNAGKTKDTVVIHWWGAPGAATAASVANEMSRTGREASVNFVAYLDDDERTVVIRPSVPVEKRAWTSGSRVTDERALTYECEPFNTVPGAMLQGLAEHIADQVRAGHLARTWRIIGHKDVSATGCPGTYYPLLATIKAKVDAMLGGKATTPPKTTVTALVPGSTDPRVSALQAGLNRVFPSYSRLAVDGSYGPLTKATVAEFQRRAKAEGRYDGAIDGLCGPLTQAALAAYGIRL